MPAIWGCVKSQTVDDTEWLVYDDSQQADPFFAGLGDKRVRYFHSDQPLTIGAKRNVLCSEALGDIIVQFDDDDFYAPHYIATMLAGMEKAGAELFKLFGFFLYHRRENLFGYWDLDANFPVHFALSANVPVQLSRTPPSDVKWGYGFSYVFKRSVWQAVPFPDRDFGEDAHFADAVRARFKSAGMQDQGCSVLHVIHSGNASRSFPQQILPPPAMADLFPGFKDYLSLCG